MTIFNNSSVLRKAQQTRNAAMAVIMIVFLFELVRTAWISDDAAITLRTVLNFINGYGATFNIGERVQAYTHPLWFLLISSLSVVIDNVFTATFLLSIVLSMLALWLLMTSFTNNLWLALAGALVLMLSKAYIDFSTSGLENPLSHLLILLSVLAGLKVLEHPKFAGLAIFFSIVSFVYLTRPDLLILMFPLVLFVIIKNYKLQKNLIIALVIGLLPALIWTLFSIYYYGFPFPNTAYAKLGTGIPIYERIIQGCRYLLDSLKHDPLTLSFIFTGMFLGLRSSVFDKVLIAGCGLYLLYCVSIGGDFMSGRFLTVPLLIATIVFIRSNLSTLQVKIAFISIIAVGILSIYTTVLNNTNYSNQEINSDGIADERGFYYQKYGLLTAEKETFASRDWQIQAKSVSIICGGLGFAGIMKGPSAHLIDECGLSDPLLARLPAKYDPNWRIGHFIRQLPTDYKESVENNTNVIADPRTKEYYKVIRNITQSQLNDNERLQNIFNINFGLIQKPDEYAYRYKPIPQSSKVPVLKAENLAKIVDSGLWNAPGNTTFDSAIDILLPKTTRIKFIDISVDNNDKYKIEYLANNHFYQIKELQPSFSLSGMVRHQFDVNQTKPTKMIRITALDGDDLYSLGHFIVNDKNKQISGKEIK